MDSKWTAAKFPKSSQLCFWLEILVFSARLWENDFFFFLREDKQVCGKGVCSLWRCSGNLTLNNTDTSLPRWGNGFINFEMSSACLAGLHSRSLVLSAAKLYKFQQLTRLAGRQVFFFPLSLPCDVLNCLPTDVIQPLRNSFCLVRLNDSSHSQRLGVRF